MRTTHAQPDDLEHSLKDRAWDAAWNATQSIRSKNQAAKAESDYKKASELSENRQALNMRLISLGNSCMGLKGSCDSYRANDMTSANIGNFRAQVNEITKNANEIIRLANAINKAKS